MLPLTSLVQCLGALALVAVPSAAAASPPNVARQQAKPVNFGFLFFNNQQLIDVAGPLDAFQMLSFRHQMNIYHIGDKVGPVGATHEHNPKNSTFPAYGVVSHTFADAPPLDVLIVPGGVGTRNLNYTAGAIKFIQERYPSLQYLITICTGALVAARSGVLDGKRATTNKASWRTVAPLFPQVKWVSPARWVVDGNIWSSSGVSSGMDLAYQFIEEVYSKDDATYLTNLIEYDRHTDPCWDPFAHVHNVTDTIEKCNATPPKCRRDE